MHPERPQGALTAAALARLLNVDFSTVKRWRKRGLIPKQALQVQEGDRVVNLYSAAQVQEVLDWRTRRPERDNS